MGSGSRRRIGRRKRNRKRKAQLESFYFSTWEKKNKKGKDKKRIANLERMAESKKC